MTKLRLESITNLLTLIAGGAGLCLLLLAGCTSTVVPKEIKASVASWDGTQQNSGFLGFDEAGNGIITYHAYNRWIALVNDYGPYFKPPCIVHIGVSPVTNDFPVRLFEHHKATGVLTNPLAGGPPGPGDWPFFRMTPEKMSQFDAMNRWRKAGRAPFQ